MDEAVDFMERDTTEQQQLGSKYLLGDQIGRGAMGVVYEGTTKDGEQLAVKILRPELSTDAKTVSRFIQERHIFSRVDHPNVVRVHDLVAEGDRLGIVMEKVSGGDLKARIESGAVTPTQAVRLAASIADGLGAIHSVDVIHRDLKPANILLTTDAEGRLMPKISDFGISRLVNEAMTRTSTTIGTPLYMAPESADQRGAGTASDVYALGAILFEMLTGTPPFHQGGTFAVLRAHALDAPAKITGVPAQLTDLIDAMLAKEPAARPSVQATRDLLLTILPQMDDQARPVALQFAAGAAETVAGGFGAAANSSETVVSNPGNGGPNDSSETAAADPAAAGPNDSSETIVAAGFGGPSDSSETIVADLNAASTGPPAGGTGPSDSSETVVSSTMFNAAAAGAAAGAVGAAAGAVGAVGTAAGAVGAAAPVNSAAPLAPAPPAMPGQPASATTGGNALAPTAIGGGGAGAAGLGTSNRSFDRVPRRVIEIGAALASMAAVAIVAFLVLNGNDGNSDGVAADQILANNSDIDPAGGGVAPESAGDNDDNSLGGFGEDDAKDDDNSSPDTTAGSNSDSESGSDSDGDGSSPTTEDTTATTEPPDETTTTTEPTTTTEKPTTTLPATTEPPVTEPPTTEPPVTEPPVTEPPVTEPPITIGPVLTPIAIIGGPVVNQRNSTSFQFNYTTNDVCGSGSFTVVRTSDNALVGSYNGDGSCYGPLHGGFPSTGGGVFGGMNLEPNTQYRVNITLQGVGGSLGSLVPGTGTVHRSFNVTTTP